MERHPLQPGLFKPGFPLTEILPPHGNFAGATEGLQLGRLPQGPAGLNRPWNGS
jgi:hypothetical protein